MALSTDLDDSVRRVLRGDTEAFGDIVRSYAGPIRAWTASQCPPGVDADDVSQDTFLEAFRRLADYTPGTDLRAWLFAIARFQLLSACTRARRVADYHSRYAPVALADELERRASEVDLGEVSERIEHLRACLEYLDAPARDALRWRYELSLPLDQIAVRCGRTVGAVKKYLYTLRRRLHECIEHRTASTRTE